MSKAWKFVVALCCAAGAMLLAPSSNAQLRFVAGGSSAAFNAVALAGEAGTTPTCTDVSPNTWNWSAKSKTAAVGRDTRTGAGTLSDQNGPVWVEWATGTSNPNDPPTAICAYIQLDSIVGQRLFFATASGSVPAGIWHWTVDCTSLSSQAGANVIPYLPADQPGLNPTVCADMADQPLNAAPTDIRAEDAKFGTERMLLSSTAGYLGYGPGPVGANVTSGIDTSFVTPVDYGIAGNDPISPFPTIAHANWQSVNVGGQVLLVLVNNQGVKSATSSDLANTSFNNIDRFVLQRAFTGRINQTRDLMNLLGIASAPLTVLHREPLSGTFNTFEFQVTRIVEANNTQEDVATTGGGVTLINPLGTSTTCPTALPAPLQGWCGSQSPMDLQWIKAGAKGNVVRVIGNGQMVSTLPDHTKVDHNGTTLSNMLGYAFFSFGNVASLSNNACGFNAPPCGIATDFGKYLSVDGADPLYTNPGDNPQGVGGIPACSQTPGGCPPASNPAPPDFGNVINGAYPIWNILRIVTTPDQLATTSGVCNPTAYVCQLVKNTQDSVANVVPDFVPMAKMKVFRSHYALTLHDNNADSHAQTFAGHNGNKKIGGVFVESGGDEAGAVFTTQEDIDSVADFGGAELTAVKQ